MRKKNKIVSFRVTDKDYAKIKSKIEKSSLGQTEYLTRCALGKDIIIVEGLREMVIQVGKIGNNLNQLTREAHMGYHVPRKEVIAIKEGLDETWQLLRTLVKEQGQSVGL